MDVVYLDYRKDFDKIPLDYSYGQMVKCGLDAPVRWICDLLRVHSKRTCKWLFNIHPPREKLHTGPQDCVLGLVLFSILTVGFEEGVGRCSSSLQMTLK